ncbi:YbaB/EbfC family nucleoid-associated protein [Kibdelosporangium persicum]|uniref:Nucleoid-associated protein YbaB n=1 Tax=Kibdelosporangium persicum TaxID=2698649 RepID=A0ABX2FG39_9PSEU|nr:YbaB/EbfC family nucleoid-associated protein [Kibdelosporangium persicum]NRN70361.1 Nucleoid-associated protein YbaB [Kibdelosporangium persicum]
MSQPDTGGIAGLARDPEAVQRSIQQWAAGFEAKAQRYRAAQEQTEQLRLSAASSDGSVRVTVRADGTVSDLQFTEKIRSMPLADLSAQVLATMRKAQSGIADKVGEVMTEQLGDEDQQTRSVMLGNLRDRFPELEDQAEDPADADKWDLTDEDEPPVEDSASTPPAPPAPAAPPVPPPSPTQPPSAPPRRRPPARDEDDDDFDPFSE